MSPYATFCRCRNIVDGPCGRHRTLRPPGAVPSSAGARAARPLPPGHRASAQPPWTAGPDRAGTRARAGRGGAGRRPSRFRRSGSALTCPFAWSSSARHSSSSRPSSRRRSPSRCSSRANTAARGPWPGIAVVVLAPGVVQQPEGEHDLRVGPGLGGEVETGGRDREPVRLAVQPRIAAPRLGENTIDQHHQTIGDRGRRDFGKRRRSYCTSAVRCGLGIALRRRRSSHRPSGLRRTCRRIPSGSRAVRARARPPLPS